MDEPGCHDQLLATLLADYPHGVMFIDLNYDDLLEQALTAFGHEVYHFTGVANYTDPSIQAKVLKLHGSVNWFVLIAQREDPDWHRAVDEADMPMGEPADEVIIERKEHSTARIFRRPNPGDRKFRLYYPLITAPLAGKALDEVSCFRSHFDRSTLLASLGRVA